MDEAFLFFGLALKQRNGSAFFQKQGSDIIHVCANSACIVPLFYMGREAVALFRSESRIDELVHQLEANKGPLSILFRTWQIVCDKNSANGTLQVPDEIWRIFSLDLETILLGGDSTSHKHVLRDAFLKLLELARANTDQTLAELYCACVLERVLFGLYVSQIGSDFSKITDMWLKDWILGILHLYSLANENESLTSSGEFVFKRLLLLGQAESYRPMFLKFDTFLYGRVSDVLEFQDTEGHETHVNRVLNVQTSGFWHQKFFGELDDSICEIFDNQLFADQPRYVCDMGCGDGSLLRRVYEVVKAKTKRGAVLHEFPLIMIGADYNAASREETQKNLTKHGVPHIVVFGDIGDPKRLIHDLVSLHHIRDVNKVLHVRSFLDHDRPFIEPVQLSPQRVFEEDMVYMTKDGQQLETSVVVQNLKEHLQRWAEALEGNDHGLLILEVHALSIEYTRRFLNESESFHFDITQAFSGQLLVSSKTFLQCAAAAGLLTDSFKCFPDPPLTRITLSFFRRKGLRIIQALPSHVPTLLELEGECWSDSGLRATKEVIEMRLETNPLGNFVLIHEDRIVSVIYTQMLKSEDDCINGMTFTSVNNFHDPDGSVVQLIIALSHPSVTYLGVSDLLVKFVLLLSLVSGKESVVGITRWSGYRRWKLSNPHGTPEMYFSLDIDPTVRWHQSRNAEVLRLIPKFRLEDKENEGFGVQLRYSLEKKSVRAISKGKGKSFEARDFEEAFQMLIAGILRLQKSENIDVNAPLLTLGLDSMDLFQLRIDAANAIGVEIPSTSIFFRYPTIKRLAEYFSLPSKSDPVVASAVESLAESFTGKKLKREASLASLGLEGKSLSKLTRSISQRLGYDVRISELSQESTVEDLVRASSQTPTAAKRNSNPTGLNAGRSRVIRLVGVSASVGAMGNGFTLDRLLSAGADFVNPPPKERKELQKIQYQGAFFSKEAVWEFDCDIFRISVREARLMDPQQRIMLSQSFDLFEKCSVDKEILLGSVDTGIFIGLWSVDFRVTASKVVDKEPDSHFSTGVSPSVCAGRVAYFFGINGPSMVIDTACSSSMVALQTADTFLHSALISNALVGAVNVILSETMYKNLACAGMLSPSSRCKTFDAAADGYARSEACVAVWLTASPDVQTETILLGTHSNQDGKTGGLTVPSQDAQESLLRGGLARASISSSKISFIEAHGTGTKQGDPIEVHGLANVLSLGEEAPVRVLSSVKTRLGHAESASGLIGLLRAMSDFKNEKISKHLHFSHLNDLIGVFNMQMMNCTLPVEEIEVHGWNDRNFSISSFGFSGTNALAFFSFKPVEDLGPRSSRCKVFFHSRKKDEIITSVEKALEILRHVSAKEIQIGSKWFQYCSYLSGITRKEVAEKLLLPQPVMETQSVSVCIICGPSVGKVFVNIRRFIQIELMEFCEPNHRMQNGSRVTFEGFSSFAESLIKFFKHQSINEYAIHTYGLGEVVMKNVSSKCGLANNRHFHASVPSFLNSLKRFGCIIEIGRTSWLKRTLSYKVWVQTLPRFFSFGPSVYDQASALGLIKRANAALISSAVAQKRNVEQKEKIESSESSAVRKAVLTVCQMESLDDDSTFSELGMDSNMIIEMQQLIKAYSGIHLPSSDFFSYFTTRKLEAHLKALQTHSLYDLKEAKGRQSFNDTKAIGHEICSYALRIADCGNAESIWDELLRCHGSFVRSTPYPGSRPLLEGAPGCYLLEIDNFNHDFFRISSREAKYMDPQQKLALEVSLEVLEGRGIVDELGDAPVGVYVGIERGEFLEDSQDDDRFLATGYSEAIAAGRISYFFGLNGPALSINTACSSSLVALSTSVDALDKFSIEKALVLGVKVLMSGRMFKLLSLAGMLSPSGRCKTFDKSADGYVRGEACVGLEVERRHTDTDNSMCEIIGCAVNQDGQSNGLTAPNGEAQTRILQAAMKNHTPDLIEAHGTGTSLGDPIEVMAIARTCLRRTREPIMLRSSKTNFGHCETAAGLVSLVMSIIWQNKNSVFHNVGMKDLNPNIGQTTMEASELVIVQENIQVLKHLLTGVSSFGYSGTNSHVMLKCSSERNKSFGSKKNYMKNITSKIREKGQIFGTFLSTVFQLSPQTKQSCKTLCKRFLSFEAKELRKDNVVPSSWSFETFREWYTVEDHVVFGEKVVPGAFFLSIALQLQVNFSTTAVVEDAIIIRPLVLTDDVSAECRKENSEFCFESTHSFGKVKHFECTLHDSGGGNIAKKFKSLTLIEETTSVFWDNLVDISYGESFRWIKMGLSENSSISCVLVKPRMLSPKKLHVPAEFLDSIFQSALLLSSTLRVPFSVKKLRWVVSEGIPQETFVDGEAVLGTDNSLVLSCHAKHYDKVFIQLEGVILQTVSKEMVEKREFEGNLFVLDWTVGKKPDAKIDASSKVAVLGVSRHHIEESFIFSTTAQLKIWLSQTQLFRTFISTFGCETHRGRDCLSLLFYLSRHLASSSVQCSMFNLTRGAYKIGREKSCNLNPWARAAWSMCRSVSLETVMTCHVTQVDFSAFDRISTTEVMQLKGAHTGQEYAIRGTVIYVPNLKRARQQNFNNLSPKSFFLVGGGSIGKALIESSVSEDFVVASRTGFISHDAKLLEAHHVVSARVDINASDLSEGLVEVLNGFGRKVDLVLFLAGILKDRLIKIMTDEELDIVLRSKILGFKRARNSFSKKRIVLFSSIASVVGNLGQSNYAAANGFLDAVSSRESSNLVKSIAWGPWNMGMFNSNNVRELPGFFKIESKNAIQALNCGINQPQSEIVLAQVDWDRVDFELFSLPLLNSFQRKETTYVESLDGIISSEDIEAFVISKVRELTLMDNYVLVDVERPLVEYGFDSTMNLELRDLICQFTKRKFPATLVFDFPTIRALVSRICEQNREVERRSIQDSPDLEMDTIQISGFSCRFAKSKNILELWDVLEGKIDTISLIPSDRFNWKDIYTSVRSERRKSASKWGSFVADMTEFDAKLFGISPREARALDPKFRKALEVSYECLCNASISISQAESDTNGKIGVFLGSWPSEYYDCVNEDLKFLATGCSPAAGSGRISYFFGLTGSCMSIDTACSSSLVAFSCAEDSLQKGRDAAAICLGANAVYSSKYYIMMSEAGMLSPDGRCKTFDDRADGYGRGEGVAAALVQRKPKDEDGIILKAVSVNQDGRSQGLTAPKGPAQSQLIEDCLKKAKLASSEDVELIEMHGTGTSLGDPIEVRAVAQGRSRGSKCLVLGSSKANFGHTETTAGILGIFKCCLSLLREKSAPQIHFLAINRHIGVPQIEEMRGVIPLELVTWKNQKLCATSSFGFSGTNSHAILKKKAKEQPEFLRRWTVLSSRTKKGLEEMKRKFEEKMRTSESFLSFNALGSQPFRATLCFAKYSRQWIEKIRGSNEHKSRVEVVLSGPGFKCRNLSFCIGKDFLEASKKFEQKRLSYHGRALLAGAEASALSTLQFLREFGVKFESVQGCEKVLPFIKHELGLPSVSKSQKPLSSNSVVIESGRGGRQNQDFAKWWLNLFGTEHGLHNAVSILTLEEKILESRSNVSWSQIPQIVYFEREIFLPKTNGLQSNTGPLYDIKKIQGPFCDKHYSSTIVGSWNEIQAIGLVHVGVWVDMVYAALSLQFNKRDSSFALKLSFLEVMRIKSEEKAEIRVKIMDELKFECWGSIGGESWKIFVKGQVDLESKLNGARRQSQQHFDNSPLFSKDSFYARLAEQGLNVGSCLALVQNVDVGSGKLLHGKLSCPPKNGLFFPFSVGVVDACCQVFLAKVKPTELIMTKVFDNFVVHRVPKMLDSNEGFVEVEVLTENSAKFNLWIDMELVLSFDAEFAVYQTQLLKNSSLPILDHAKKIIGESLGIWELPSDEPLLNIGVDSISAIALSNLYESYFGYSHSVADILTKSLQETFGAPEKSKVTKKKEWFYRNPLLRSEAKTIIYCFPYGGGDESSFLKWEMLDVVPKSVQIIPVLLPGHGVRSSEEPWSNIHSLANAVAEKIALNTLENSHEVVLFGHSFGGFLSILCEKILLQKWSIRVKLTCISACSAYGVQNKILNTVLKNCGLENVSETKNMNIEAMQEWFSEFNSWGNFSSQKIPYSILKALLADMICVEQFLSQNENPEIHSPLLGFCADRDDSVSLDSMQQWRKFSAKFELIVVSATSHLYIDSMGHEVLKEIIERV